MDIRNFFNITRPAASRDERSTLDSFFDGFDGFDLDEDLLDDDGMDNMFSLDLSEREMARLDLSDREIARVLESPGVELEETEMVVLCELCQTRTSNLSRHMRITHPGCGRSCGHQGYRSNGAYVDGWLGGACGTGNPYYLLCRECRGRYISDRQTQGLQNVDATGGSSAELPYAKLLAAAPDLLGSPIACPDQGNIHNIIYNSSKLYSNQTTGFATI